MLREIPFKRLLEWEAYDELEPIGGLRGDWQAASICRMLADLAMIRAGARKRFRTQDFLLEFGTEREAKDAPEPRRQTWQEQKMIGRMFAEAFNADLQPKKKGRRRNG